VKGYSNGMMFNPSYTPPKAVDMVKTSLFKEIDQAQRRNRVKNSTYVLGKKPRVDKGIMLKNNMPFNKTYGDYDSIMEYEKTQGDVVQALLNFDQREKLKRNLHLYSEDRPKQVDVVTDLVNVMPDNVPVSPRSALKNQRMVIGGDEDFEEVTQKKINQIMGLYGPVGDKILGSKSPPIIIKDRGVWAESAAAVNNVFNDIEAAGGGDDDEGNFIAEIKEFERRFQPPKSNELRTEDEIRDYYINLPINESLIDKSQLYMKEGETIAKYKKRLYNSSKNRFDRELKNKKKSTV
jgi:hypothetical protein